MILLRTARDTRAPSRSSRAVLRPCTCPPVPEGPPSSDVASELLLGLLLACVLRITEEGVRAALSAVGVSVPRRVSVTSPDQRGRFSSSAFSHSLLSPSRRVQRARRDGTRFPLHGVGPPLQVAGPALLVCPGVLASSLRSWPLLAKSSSPHLANSSSLRVREQPFESVVFWSLCEFLNSDVGVCDVLLVDTWVTESRADLVLLRGCAQFSQLLLVQRETRQLQHHSHETWTQFLSRMTSWPTSLENHEK